MLALSFASCARDEKPVAVSPPDSERGGPADLEMRAEARLVAQVVSVVGAPVYAGSAGEGPLLIGAFVKSAMP